MEPVSAPVRFSAAHRRVVTVVRDHDGASCEASSPAPNRPGRSPRERMTPHSGRSGRVTTNSAPITEADRSNDTQEPRPSLLCAHHHPTTPMTSPIASWTKAAGRRHAQLAQAASYQDHGEGGEPRKRDRQRGRRGQQRGPERKGDHDEDEQGRQHGQLRHAHLAEVAQCLGRVREQGEHQVRRTAGRDHRGVRRRARPRGPQPDDQQGPSAGRDQGHHRDADSAGHHHQIAQRGALALGATVR